MEISRLLAASLRISTFAEAGESNSGHAGVSKSADRSLILGIMIDDLATAILAADHNRGMTLSAAAGRHMAGRAIESRRA
jgi:hypothetical protein